MKVFEQNDGYDTPQSRQQLLERNAGLAERLEWARQDLVSKIERIAELEAQLTAAMKDACRYNWLVYAGWFDEEIMKAHNIDEGISDTVDNAIDVAMKVQN